MKTRHLDPAGYLSQKTIVALSTPAGGALAVVRVSGSDASRILLALSKNGGSLEDFSERAAKRIWLVDGNQKAIDDAVVVRYVGPRSFTGEDLIEISIHGSARIAQRLIDRILELGARPALPGEFSFRAVKNGKLQLSQAEAIKEVIAADNDLSLELALEKLSGSQHRFVEELQQELMQLVTLAEAGIDFSDQDLDEVSLPTLKKRAQQSLELLGRLSGSFQRGKRFADGVPVAFLGLPNAGKSSFFNALLGEDRSIVSEIAGTTRDVVREKIFLQDPATRETIAIRLADTAGIRKSDDQIEEIGVTRSLKSAEDSDLIVLIVDGKTTKWDEFLVLASQESIRKKPRVVVLTKKDQLSAEQLAKTEKELKGHLPELPSVWVSSTRLEGVDRAGTLIASTARKLIERSPGEVVLTQFEHVNAVENSINCLKNAQQTPDIVLFATEVRHALNALGPLLGQTIPDDILGKIFSDFCIGK